MKTSFVLTLSKSMLEYLCATADDVRWDRGIYTHGSGMPENFIATQASLAKRGLIQRKDQTEIDTHKYDGDRHHEWALYILTPAGEKVVQLLKLAGMFVEADAALTKKHRRKA